MFLGVVSFWSGGGEAEDLIAVVDFVFVLPADSGDGGGDHDTFDAGDFEGGGEDACGAEDGGRNHVFFV